ncbi:MAG: hypothetical protein VB021_05705 [Oscillospiraceae bacterium]|nr:hypothetical protein [Oscillospiraceae bacterium]
MIVVSDVRIPLGAGEDDAVGAACARLHIRESAVADHRLRRMSYDARHREVTAVCSVLLTLRDAREEARLAAACPSSVTLAEKRQLTPVFGAQRLSGRPVVAGFGPAGMFAAYLLSLYGYRPLVLERGGDMDERVRATEGFFRGGGFDPVSNVQFGEGGAGTFSDGKLTTRINDPLCDFVLETLAEFGAPQDVLVRAKPHVGTDRLRAVVRALRQAVCANGGEILFRTQLDGLRLRDGALCGVTANGQAVGTNALVLACGHSARDTFALLRDSGLALEAKPFSVGARIEHAQRSVDRAMYGDFAGDPRLPHGEYALSAHVGGRCVYTFCMCPGGSVVPAASEQGGVVTNGMSNYARDGANANAALVVSVGPQDFGNDPFAAIDYQRALERAAFTRAGGDYRAPACDVQSFLSRTAGLRAGGVGPTYARGVTPCDFDALYGGELADAMRAGLRIFSKKLAFFGDGGAVLTGPETRTSSPVRVPRGETREAAGARGIYPCGEGAGYAGGIMSAAVDGLRSALAVMARFARAE